MLLTKDEEAILEGERGYSKQKAMSILVALGEIYGADRLISISSAQISGVSYKSIGEPGLKWLRSLVDAKVSVLTTLNPSGMDLKEWRTMGISEEFAEKQLEIIDVFRKMGILITCTCTPYLTGNIPGFGEHVAWAESSAVCYANSVIGARTNREGGPSALAAAIIGKVPRYGLHMDENRKAKLKINVLADLNEESDFGALGYIGGKIAGNRIPLFKGIKSASIDDLKSLGAALATSGGVPMFHIENLTPEAENALIDKVEEFSVNRKDIEDIYSELSNIDSGEVDLVAFGCPHASLSEIARIAEALKGKKVRTKLWIFTSNMNKRLAKEKGYLSMIRGAGGNIFSDCCMIVSPIENLFRSIAVNSAKAAFYAATVSGFKVVFRGLGECIDIALRGGLY